MTQLTPGIYGTPGKEKHGPFGLFWGQERRPREDVVIRNAGWYNKLGERIGFGDLTRADLLWIMKEIAEDELFIILSDYDSYDKFLESKYESALREYHKHPKRDDKAVAGRKLDSPGVDYVAEYCVLVINHQHIYHVEQRPAVGGVLPEFRDDPFFVSLPRKDVKAILTGSQAS